MEHSNSAVEIGSWYSVAINSQLNSVRFLHLCGTRLAEVKAALPYGSWELWLKEHQAKLGFAVGTARRLVRLANQSLATDLTEEQAVQVSRQVWGHEIELTPTAPTAFSGHYRRITGFVDWIEKHAVDQVPDAELIELRPRMERIRRWIDEVEGKARRLNLRLAG